MLAGLAGGLAMIPVGLALRAAGLPVNRYGELLAVQLTGSGQLAVVAAIHLAVSLLSAVPLALARHIHPFERIPAPLFGAGFGAGYWLAINAVALPWWFSRASPFAEGADAVWPSLLVHVLYGVVAATVLGRAERRRTSPRNATA